MEFTRKRKRGYSQKVCKFWFSEECYRIIWRREVCGVEVPAKYQATVRTAIPNYGGNEGEWCEMWDFVMKPRLYGTLKAAQRDCEKHKRLWGKACEATGIRGLTDIFGKVPIEIPLWARKKLPPRVYEVLAKPRTGKHGKCEPDPNDPTKTSDCSVSPTGAMPASLTPVLSVEDKAPTSEWTSPPPYPTDTTPSTAKPAKAPVKAQKKRVTKRITKQSPSTTKKRKPTTRSTATARKPVTNSAKKRSKRSKK